MVCATSYPLPLRRDCRFSGPTGTLQALATVLSVLVAQQRARGPPPLQPQKLLFLIESGAGRPARSFVAPASLPVLFCGPKPSVPLILRKSTASLQRERSRGAMVAVFFATIVTRGLRCCARSSTRPPHCRNARREDLPSPPRAPSAHGRGRKSAPKHTKPPVDKRQVTCSPSLVRG